MLEVLLAIVVMAVLISIALPSLLSQQDKAKNVAVSQYLTTAWQSARGVALTNDDHYPSAASLVGTLAGAEPELAFSVAASCATATFPNNATVVVDDSASSGNDLVLYAKSDSGTIYQLDASATGLPTITQAC